MKHLFTYILPQKRVRFRKILKLSRSKYCFLVETNKMKQFAIIYICLKEKTLNKTNKTKSTLLCMMMVIC